MKTKAKSAASSVKGVSKVSLSMVGFFDILGFSSRVEKVQSAAELVKIADIVESIRRHFEFKSKDKNIRELHTILDKQVIAFSDCVVTAVSAHTKFVRDEGIFDTFGSEILDMAYSQIRCVWDGYFLRGGVDIGYWYYDKGVLVSPALVGAYKEEKVELAILSFQYRLSFMNYCAMTPDAMFTAKTLILSATNSLPLYIQIKVGCISSIICGSAQSQLTGSMTERRTKLTWPHRGTPRPGTRSWVKGITAAL